MSLKFMHFQYNNMLPVIFTALFYFSPFAKGIEMEDCGSYLGGVNQVTISGCDQFQSTCILDKGINASIEVDFTTYTGASAVMIVVHGIKYGMRVGHTMDIPNTCDDPESGIKCPIATGMNNRYRAAATVPTFCPSISGTVEMKLQNEDGRSIVCLRIPVEIR